MTASPPPADTRRDAPGDLGFGRVASDRTHARFLRKDGTVATRKYGLGRQLGEHLILAAMRMPWSTFLLWTVGTFLLTAGVFALGFTGLGTGALAGTEGYGLGDAFFRAFVFSVGVLTTVGTGPAHAVGITAHWLVVLESLTGVLLLLGAAGLVLARLSRPRARIRFSQCAVIAPYQGGRAWMFRMINLQPSELLDTHVRVNLSWFEEVDGVRTRRFHQLRLERSTVEFFTLHWTLVHVIGPDSPLRGVTPELLRKGEAEFVLLVTALEETFATRVQARTSYTWEEVRWDAKWADMFVDAPDGIVTVDAERLDRVERLEEGATRVPAAGELQDAARA